MKRVLRRRLLLLIPPLFFVFRVVVFAQSGPMPEEQGHRYYTYGQLRGVSHYAVMRAVADATTIPMFDYSVTASRDGNTYSGVMVGRSPFFHGARTTSIPVVIVPIKFTMSNGVVFDPTAPDDACAGGSTAIDLLENSPLFSPAAFTMPTEGGMEVGTGQYVDEFQRANFWQYVSVTGDRFHTTLGPISAAPVQSVKVPKGRGKSYAAACGRLGAIDGQWWDSKIFGGGGNKAEKILTALTKQGLIGPTTLPIFVFYNVVMDSYGDSDCSPPGGCALGYHNALPGKSIQTYITADYDTDGFARPELNSAPLSHELAEWMDDPLGNNPVPTYGHVGEVAGCQKNLEVADPLQGIEFPPVTLNDTTYTVQELAFFSWFYGGPSVAVDETFSDNDTFTSPAFPCSKD
jgi:hypothetical protein